MIRGENVISGTTTTGTGTLTLAAPPSGFGGADPFAYFSGYGLGTSQATPLLYTIIEYDDLTKANPTPVQLEKGFGNLLIGANLAASTLTRNALVTETSLNAQPATITNGNFATPATSITIGTAANIIVFIGASAWDSMQCLHAYSTGGISGADGLGVAPWNAGSGGSTNLTSGTILYGYLKTDVSDVIKSCSIRIKNAVVTPTSSSVALALYAVGAAGLPAKKLIDFGTNSSNPLATANTTLTLTAGAGVPIMAGGYILAFLPIWSGGTGTPSIQLFNPAGPAPFGTVLSNPGPNNMCSVAGQSSLTDPATTTAIAAYGQSIAACAFRNT